LTVLTIFYSEGDALGSWADAADFLASKLDASFAAAEKAFLLHLAMHPGLGMFPDVPDKSFKVCVDAKPVRSDQSSVPHQVW